MKTIIDDEPVEAFFWSDAQWGTWVECQRCYSLTFMEHHSLDLDGIFKERCSFCECKLKYPDGASW